MGASRSNFRCGNGGKFWRDIGALITTYANGKEEKDSYRHWSGHGIADSVDRHLVFPISRI